MKILFVAPLPPPVHGSAMVSQYIKDSKLVQDAFDCDFVNLSTSRRMDEIGKGGVKKILRFVGSYFTVFFKLLTHRYDLCYLAITCHGMGFLKDAPFVLLCKLFVRKIVLHQHNKGMSKYVDKQPYKWLLPLVYKNTKVILLSWYLYPDIERVVRREQVVVCPNGIPPLDKGQQSTDNGQQSVTSDLQSEVEEEKEYSHTDCTDCTESFACQRDLHTITQNGKSLRPCCRPDGDTKLSAVMPESPLLGRGRGEAPRLLFLSNLIESKGIYVLLDACKVLKERGLDFQCDYVGGESKAVSAEQFRAAIAERGLSGCVTYHGPKYGEEKNTFFAQADVFVQPTYDDCFPLTLVEAMQWRLPIVSTDVGAVPDMVQDGENGFVCPQQDVHSLADALERLITDPVLRQQMGQRGYERYQTSYTLGRFEEQIVETLRNVLLG